ncbi:MAG: HNH endonuclease, partial [Frankiaceae bacterium]|nr:HNH endonuclease [Frankiaceae bacterium]
LLDLAASPPGRFHPRHPDDHPRGPGGQQPDPPGGQQPDPPGGGDPQRPDRSGGPPDRPRSPDDDPSRRSEPAPAAGSGLPAALGAPHPLDTPGPYAVTGLLRELVFTRAPVCEFPGCGAKAESCDAEHDLAHPDGPTCSCNLGPCCRRHHRVKQQGWTKTRQTDSAVLWAGPTGRTWLSPSQHQPPAAPVRPLPPLPSADPLDELSPTYADDELWEHLDRPDDPVAYELRATDAEPGDVDPDPLGDDTRWTLDLTDPYAWTDQPLLG